MDTKLDNNSEKEKKTYSFYDVARRILLAGIGAIAISHDEVEVFIDKLVERGELAKRDGETLLKEVREKRMKHFHGDESHFQKRIEEFLNQLNVPAKKDFDELSGKISALEKKIDELTKGKP